MSVPLIDLTAARSGSEIGKQRIAEQISDACMQLGFFTITGHGIDKQVIEEAFLGLEHFFALPNTIKQSCYSDEKPIPFQHNGYKALYAENAYAAMGRLDMRGDKLEKFSMTRWILDDQKDLPFLPSTFGQALRVCMKHYYRQCQQLTQLLTELFAIASDLPHDFFDDKTDQSWDYLRFHYFPGFDDARQQEGLASHTDGSLLTLLADVTEGLQVQARNGEWVTMEKTPMDQFVVNIGDPYARWTNDHWVSTPHRVVLGQAERRSIAFFKVPNDDALIDAIPKFCQYKAKKYPPISYYDWITQRRTALGEKNNIQKPE